VPPHLAKETEQAMPAVLVIITDTEPNSAPQEAHDAAEEVLRLVNSEIPSDLSLVDRLKQIARQAVRLAKAYQQIEIEALSSTTREEAAPVPQGCVAEADPNAN
jgi:hypothetical protein